MHSISIDTRTYRRLLRFAEEAGISVDRAACDSIDNWMDITSDPHIATAALNSLAAAALRSKVGAESKTPQKVTFINASRAHRSRTVSLELPRLGKSGPREVLR
jgi:hypothetical protein